MERIEQFKKNIDKLHLNVDECRNLIKIVNEYREERSIEKLVKRLLFLLQPVEELEIFNDIRKIILKSHIQDYDFLLNTYLYGSSKTSPGKRHRRYNTVPVKIKQNLYQSIPQSRNSGLKLPISTNHKSRVQRAQDQQEDIDDSYPLYNIKIEKSTERSIGFSVRGGSDYGIGIFVSNVEKDSAAERGGLQFGDRIIEVNGTSFENMTHVDAVHLLRIHSTLLLKVQAIGKIPISKEFDNDDYVLMQDKENNMVYGSIRSISSLSPGTRKTMSSLSHCSTPHSTISQQLKTSSSTLPKPRQPLTNGRRLPIPDFSLERFGECYPADATSKRQMESDVDHVNRSLKGTTGVTRCTSSAQTALGDRLLDHPYIAVKRKEEPRNVSFYSTMPTRRHNKQMVNGEEHVTDRNFSHGTFPRRYGYKQQQRMINTDKYRSQSREDLCFDEETHQINKAFLNGEYRSHSTSSDPHVYSKQYSADIGKRRAQSQQDLCFDEETHQTYEPLSKGNFYRRHGYRQHVGEYQSRSQDNLCRISKDHDYITQRGRLEKHAGICDKQLRVKSSESKQRGNDINRPQSNISTFQNLIPESSTRYIQEQERKKKAEKEQKKKKKLKTPDEGIEDKKAGNWILQRNVYIPAPPERSWFGENNSSTKDTLNDSVESDFIWPDAPSEDESILDEMGRVEIL